MEDLNKQQLILLALLVSFVTSIATGIITYTLLQEAPVEITQTINRVVERTIEKVVPVENGEGETVTEVTTVVSEEDLVLESINKNTKSIVRLGTKGSDGSDIVAGMGLVISLDGTIVMDRRNYSTNLNYDIIYHDGQSYTSAKRYEDISTGLVFIRPGKPATDSYTFYPIVTGNSDSLRLGQTLIAIGGKDRNSVSIGRVSELETTGGSVGKINTDIRTARSTFGSPVLNLSGQVVGIEAPFSIEDSYISYFPINNIQTVFKNALENLSK
jgi:S1-C subfamily serine protease